MSSENAGFGQAREICYRSNFNGAGAGNSNCSMHFTGTYDRRKSGTEDRRVTRPDDVKSHPRRRLTVATEYGRRTGDAERAQTLVTKSKPVEPRVSDRQQRGRRITGSRRVNIADRLNAFIGQRRGLVQDRLVVRTEGSPVRRGKGYGRRVGDTRSYVFLPWATKPVVPPKPSLRERVQALRERPETRVIYGDWIKADAVLDLLKEYGVEDA